MIRYSGLNILSFSPIHSKLNRKLMSSIFDSTYNSKYVGEKLLKKFEELKQGQALNSELILRFINEQIIRHDPQNIKQSDFLKTLSEEVFDRINGWLNIERTNELIVTVQSTNFSTNNAHSLISLEYFIMSNGLYRVAKYVREKAVIRAINDHGLSFSSIIDKFSAIMESGQYRAAKDMILSEYRKTSRLRFVKRLLLDRMLHYNSILCGDFKDIDRLNEKYLEQGDRAFAELITGKTVALVGPSDSRAISGQEIDGYDIVIRLNYQGQGNMPEPDRYGARIDVSYFNSNNARKNLAIAVENPLHDLKYAVFKSRKQAQMASEICPSRMARSPENFWLQGWPNMIQLALYDLLSYKTRKIKLFKINFYLAESLHFNGYQTRHVNLTDPKSLFSGHACHHIVRQLDFIRMMVQNGLIEVDDECKSIINMSNDEYLGEMEKIYVTRHFKIIGS